MNNSDNFELLWSTLSLASHEQMNAALCNSGMTACAGSREAREELALLVAECEVLAVFDARTGEHISFDPPEELIRLACHDPERPILWRGREVLVG